MNILVVDDSQADRELAITYIRKSNGCKQLTTDESNCLQDALQKIRDFDYDVILLDLALPESDGIETIKTIQKEMESQGKDIPVVILTGYEDYKVGRMAFSMGIKDFLIKGETAIKDLSRALTLATFNQPRKAVVT